MASTTTNYSFYLPAVNDPTDEDLWGGYLNDNTTSLDSLLFTATNWVKRDVSSSASVSTSDRNKVLLVDASGGAVTITLGAAATLANGFCVAIKKTDSSTNAVTIDGNSSETIDGAATFTLPAQYSSVILQCDGANWNIVGRPNMNTLSSGTLGAGVGAIATAGNLGTISSGTVTPLATTNGNFNYYTNNGAHTLAPPAGVCTMVIEIVNGASAGAITTSGFTKVTGDSLTTTNGHKFMCYITKNQSSLLSVVALQ